MGPVILNAILKSLDSHSSVESGLSLCSRSSSTSLFCAFVIASQHNFNVIDMMYKIHSDATARDTKAFSFQAIGLLAQRMPQLFRLSPAFATFLQSRHSYFSDLLKLLCPTSFSSSQCIFSFFVLFLVLPNSCDLKGNTMLTMKTTHFSNKIDMAVRLFDALKVEAQHLRLVIQEATNSLCTAYKVCYIFFIQLKLQLYSYLFDR